MQSPEAGQSSLDRQNVVSRRRLLISAVSTIALRKCAIANATDKQPASPYYGIVGITTGGGVGEQRRRGELDLLKLPEYVQTKLGMQVIDLNTHWINDYSDKYLKQVKSISQSEGCQFSNLKVNHKFGDLYSKNPLERDQAITAAKKLIDAAHILGTKWIRFTLRASNAKNPVTHRKLAEYAKPSGIQLLIENGSRQADISYVTNAVKAIGVNVAACPDTGNWADEFRMKGLLKTFPGAVSCDFKVYELTPDRKHPKYDIKQCFDIGWQSGFRGPWIIEHMKPTTKGFIADTVYIRDLLKSWIKSASIEQPE